MAQVDIRPASMNPAGRWPKMSEALPRSSQARKQKPPPPAPPSSQQARFHEQIGSAQYRREIDAIYYAIDPSSCHEGELDSDRPLLDDTEPDRRCCFQFDQDLRLADDVDLDEVTEWVRRYVGCRLCIARVRNAVRIHAAYRWYEVRQRVSVSMKSVAISEGKRSVSPPWKEDNVGELTAWMKESVQISEVTSS